MTEPSPTVAPTVRRRLSLSAVRGFERTMVAGGLLAAVASAAILVALSSGAVAGRMRAPVLGGVGWIAPDWLLAATVIIGALSIGVILTGAGDRPWVRRSGGLAIAYWAGTLLTAGLSPFRVVVSEPRFIRLAEALCWAALGIGLCLFAIQSRARHRFTIPGLGMTGVALIGGCLILGLAGADPWPNSVRAELTTGTSFLSGGLGIALVAFGAWLAAEGAHASIEVGAKIRGRLDRRQSTSSRWLASLVALKLVLLLVAATVLPARLSEAWVSFRDEGPFPWAVALAAAAGALWWLSLANIEFPARGAINRAILLVVVLWSAPFLIALIVIAVAQVSRVLIPASVNDLVSVSAILGLVVAARLPRRHLGYSVLLGSLAAGALVASAHVVVPAQWLKALSAEVAVVRVAGIVIDWVLGATEAWQILVMAGLVVIAVLIRKTRWRLLSIPLFIIGLWALPGAVQVWSDTTTANPVRTAPGLLGLDIAFTILVAWCCIARPPWFLERAKTIGLALVVLTLATHIPILVGPPLAELTSWIASRRDGLSADGIAAGLLLIIPVAYTYLFDSRDLNRAAAARPILIGVGTTCLLLFVAVSGLGFGVSALTEVSLDDLLQSIALPALLLLMVSAWTAEQEARVVDQGPARLSN